MADEVPEGGGGAGGEEVSVGDLVVHLDGDGAQLFSNLESTLGMLDRLLPAAQKLDNVLQSMGSHAASLRTIGDSLRQIETLPATAARPRESTVTHQINETNTVNDSRLTEVNRRMEDAHVSDEVRRRLEETSRTTSRADVVNRVAEETRRLEETKNASNRTNVTDQISTADTVTDTIRRTEESQRQVLAKRTETRIIEETSQVEQATRLLEVERQRETVRQVETLRERQVRQVQQVPTPGQTWTDAGAFSRTPQIVSTVTLPAQAIQESTVRQEVPKQRLTETNELNKVAEERLTEVNRQLETVRAAEVLRERENLTTRTILNTSNVANVQSLSTTPQTILSTAPQNAVHPTAPNIPTLPPTPQGPLPLPVSVVQSVLLTVTWAGNAVGSGPSGHSGASFGPGGGVGIPPAVQTPGNAQQHDAHATLYYNPDADEKSYSAHVRLYQQEGAAFHEMESRRRLDMQESERVRINVWMEGTERELAMLQQRNAIERENRQRQGIPTNISDDTARLQETVLRERVIREGIIHEQQERAEVDRQPAMRAPLEAMARARAVQAGRMAPVEEEAGGGGASGEHEGGISHYVLRRVGYHAGLALGAAGVGNDLTGILTAVEAFGPALGVASVAAITLGSILASNYAKAEEFRQSLVAYNGELRQTVASWREVAAAQAPANSVSSLALSHATQSQNRQGELQEKLDATKREAFGGYLANELGGPTVSVLTGGLAGEMRDIAQQQKQVEFQKTMAEQQEAVYLKQSTNEIAFNESERQMADERVRIGAMLESPLKRRLALENEIAEGRLQLFHKQRQEREAAAFAKDQAIAVAQEAVLNAERQLVEARHQNRTFDIQQANEAIDRAVDQENKTRTFHENIEQNIRVNQVGQTLSASRQGAAKIAGDQGVVDTETIANRNALNQAIISSHETGYAKELDMLRARNAAEKAERSRSHHESIDLDKTAQEVEREVLRDHLEKSKAMWAEWGAVRAQAGTTGFARQRVGEEETFREQERVFVRDNRPVPHPELGPVKSDMRFASENATFLSDLRALRETHALRMRMSNEEHDNELRNIQTELDSAVAAAHLIGIARRREQENIQFKEEMVQFRRANTKPGDEEVAQQKEQAFSVRRETERSDDRVALTDEEADMARRVQVLYREITQGAADWASKLREITREHEYTTAEIEKYRKAFMEVRTAQENAGVLDQMRDLRIELGLVTHSLTQMTAEYLRMKLAHPDADDGLLKQEARLNAYVKAVQFAHGELSRLHPAMQVRDYAQQLREAVDAGGLSARDANDLFKQKEFDTFHRDVGQANTSYVPGQVDIRGVNMNPQVRGSNLDLRHPLFGSDLDRANVKDLDKNQADMKGLFNNPNSHGDDILRDNGRALASIDGTLKTIAQQGGLH